MSALTTADADQWRMQEVAHLNGKGWFGYGHRCVEQPRLYRLDKYTRGRREVVSTWSVDGEDCTSLEAAISKLNTDPALTELDRDTLTRVTPSLITRKDFKELFGDDWHTRYYWLVSKGLMSWKSGSGQLTELGAAMRPGPSQ